MGFFYDKLIDFQISLLLGKKKKGILKELDKAKKDPKLLNAFSNLGDLDDRIELNLAKLCERNPNHPKCVGVESYETVLKRQNDKKQRLRKLRIKEEQKEDQRQKKWKNPNKWYTYDSWFVIVFIFFPIPFGIYGAIMRLISKNPNWKADFHNNNNTSTSSVVSKDSEEEIDKSFWRHPFLVEKLPIYLIIFIIGFLAFAVLIGMLNNKFS